MNDVAAHKTKAERPGKHNVRFPDGQDDNCNKIHVLKTEGSANDVEIHAGFFKVDHKYEVEFEVPDGIGLGNDAIVDIPSEVHITLRDVQQKKSGICLTIAYHPIGVDGIVNEVFSIKSKDGSKEMKGIFRAEVLGREQGTPMLKDGVRCIQRPPSASSSVSS